MAQLQSDVNGNTEVVFESTFGGCATVVRCVRQKSSIIRGRSIIGLRTHPGVDIRVLIPRVTRPKRS